MLTCPVCQHDGGNFIWRGHAHLWRCTWCKHELTKKEWLNMLRDKGPCPHCEKGTLQATSMSDTHVDLECDACQAEFRVYPKNTVDAKTLQTAQTSFPTAKCPKCQGSGIDHGLVMDHRGVHRYKCYSCNHEWTAEPKNTNSARKAPDSLACPYCPPYKPGHRICGTYQKDHGTYHIYKCPRCARQFCTHNSDPQKALPYAPGDLQGEHLQELERNAPPWEAGDRWIQHAEEAGRGGLIWWPQGLSIEKRREFINEARALLRPFGPIKTAELFAVADSLFRLWVNWITTNA